MTVLSRIIISGALMATPVAGHAAAASDGPARPDSPPGVPAAATGQGIEVKLAEARANLAAAEALGEAALTNTPAGISLQDVATRRALLQRLVPLYEQQLSNTAELETVKSRRAQAAREAQLAAAQAAVRMLRLMLESGNVERAMWEMRFAAHDTRSVETLTESRRRLDAFTLRLDLWKEFQRQEFGVSSSEIELQETRLRTLAADSDLLPLARERLAALRERDELLLRLVRRLEQAQRLSQMIASAFAEHGIVIAFPQRDLRLDTVRPLPVEIVAAGGERPVVGQAETPKHRPSDNSPRV